MLEKKHLVVCLVLLLFGCSSHPPTEEEQFCAKKKKEMASIMQPMSHDALKKSHRVGDKFNNTSNHGFVSADKVYDEMSCCSSAKGENKPSLSEKLEERVRANQELMGK